LRRALGEAAVVIAAGIAVALATNAFRHDGLPLRTDPRSLRVGAGVPILGVASAHEAFEKGAVFVDARPHAAYLAGHVEGALSIPPENPDAAYRDNHDFLPPDAPVVVYAAAAEASVAGARATWLKTMGHAGASVLVDGWEAWQRAGYPAATGE
jgi:rhodanese-related sulfurtransferase